MKKQLILGVITVFISLFVISLTILAAPLFGNNSGYRDEHEYCLDKEKGADSASITNCLLHHLPRYYIGDGEYCYGNGYHFDFAYEESDYFLENYEIAYVSFEKLKHNVDHEKRGEYVFEVKEWLKGGNEEETLVIYSKKEPGMFHSYYECWGCYTFERGKEYIIFLDNKGNGKYGFSSAIVHLDGTERNGYEYPICFIQDTWYDATYFGSESKNVDKEEFVRLIKEAINALPVS